MFGYILISLLIFNVQRYVYGAVLTTTTIHTYFPLAHNTNSATDNGVFSYLGASNGLTSFVFSDPHDTSVLATYIAGNSVVEVIASISTAIASYSCDLGTAQATCHFAQIDPKNGQIVSTSIINDSLNPVALIEVGPPDVLTQAPSFSQSATGPPPTSVPLADTTGDAIQGLLPAPSRGSATRPFETLCITFLLTMLSVWLY